MQRRQFLLCFICCVGALAAESTPITIPSLAGALAIDGSLDDPAWQGAQLLTLASPEFGAAFPAGGDLRIGVRGAYLCLSARMPEPDRLVAHSFGRNPNWWPEDLITWSFRIHSAASRRNLNVSLAVNPLGAWRFQNNVTMEPLDAQKILVATRRDSGQWRVEAAIPLDLLAENGFFSVQRTRVPRPVAPELRWYWPAPNEQAVFELAKRTADTAPEFHPQPTPASSNTKSAHKAADAFGWLPKTVWTTEQRERLHASSMLESSLRARMAHVADEEKLAWKKVNSVETWEDFRDKRVAALRILDPFPPRTALHAVVTHRADYGDGFVIENIVFESRPKLLVTANLYLPASLPRSVPAVIVVHAHHAPKTQSELQDLGMTWARSGTAVLVMDQLCAGERSQSQPWNRESYYGRYALGNQLLVAGESLMKWMVWDLMRAVDLLLERPYIDQKRIIMLGAVAGGGDPAAVTAALDPRIAAVIPFNFGEAGPEEHYTLGPRGYDFDTAWPGWGSWETTRNMPRSAVDQFFPWMICASVAPRPFLYSFEIGWPRDVEHEPMWARYKKVFDLYGARDRLDEVHGFGPFPGPGECTNVGAFLRKRIYPVVSRWFGLAVPAAEYHNVRPESELMCLTPAVAADRSPKFASTIALELAHQRLSASRSRIAALSAEQRRTALQDVLKDKLGDIEPLATNTVQTLWVKSGAQATAEALAVETETDITLPVLLLKPAKPASSRMPVVLAIAQGGKGLFLSERSPEIAGLLGKGVAVCLPDLRGMGELADTESRGPQSMDLAATEFMLGDTLLGARLKDTLTLVRYLASRPDMDAARIAVWGDSFVETNPDDFAFDQSDMQEPGMFVQHQAEPLGALLALLTGLFQDQIAAVAARGGLVSFLSLLEDRFCHTPQDVIVPGILTAADVPDIVGGQSARGILLEGFVDGRNILVENDRLQSELQAVVKTPSGLIVRRAAAEPSIASWLADRITQ